MRLFMLVLVAATLVLGGVSQSSAGADGLGAGALRASAAYALDQPDGRLDIDIDVNKGPDGGGQWYENPMWIAIGGLAVLLLLVLLVIGSRGGGTTVVKG